MRELRTAVIAIVALTLVLGVAYPLVITGVSQVAFSEQADGDPELIGRDFSEVRGAFQSRPSVTGYSTTATFFNNLGPNQQDLADLLTDQVNAYLERERPFTPGLTAADVPADAATTSASGVDPHISAANARIQANRVAQERGLDRAEVLALIDDHSSRPLFGLGGPKSINVVALNAALEDH